MTVSVSVPPPVLLIFKLDAVKPTTVALTPPSLKSTAKLRVLLLVTGDCEAAGPTVAVGDVMS